MDISNELYSELRKLTRKAQRRMERATPGQLRALEFWTEKATGEKKWSSSVKGMNERQVRAQIDKLNTFLEGN